ncbi:hypothetical protein IscW_ISCW017660 [Ixodes scapularis]|uniref:Exocyst component Exo84 C-terminal domain-containing protein n=1 Tax=Ixodes scapularis TaxID=6945 RepID=B7PJP6_IXOSC|nr:hypothetical protein IscW_ISCW017660 [Ixodes scapularis]|eukprot:XP_002408376.1 hypothetical protein IscW_ISCW017660 [Ixodes scapularis]
MAEYAAVGDKFTSPGFSPSNYVKDLVQNSVRIDAILSERQQIANLADETNNLLKKNVYKNYMQFIETAKEISCILHILDVKDRHIVHSGEVNELKENQSSSKIYAVLLSDCLVLADWLPHRRGPVQYRFQVAYELDNLAVVNVSEDQTFDEDEGEDGYGCEAALVLPEWLSGLPEDLDVCVAERDFEAAVSLVLKTQEHLALYPKAKALEDMSGIMKYSMRQQKMEGATAPYIKRLCELFFASMVDTGREFNQAFGNSNSCASAFVVWARDQLHNFVKVFSNHVFTTQVSLSEATECILAVRTHCEQLWEIGLDLSFMLERLLKNDVERIITDSRDKALEAIKLRAADDRWRAQNLYKK